MIEAECAELLDKIKASYQIEIGEPLDSKLVFQVVKEQREALAKRFIHNRISHLVLAKTIKFENFVREAVLQGLADPIPASPILSSPEVPQSVEKKSGRPIKAPAHK